MNEQGRRRRGVEDERKAEGKCEGLLGSRFGAGAK